MLRWAVAQGYSQTTMALSSVRQQDEQRLAMGDEPPYKGGCTYCHPFQTCFAPCTDIGHPGLVRERLPVNDNKVALRFLWKIPICTASIL